MPGVAPALAQAGLTLIAGVLVAASWVLALFALAQLVRARFGAPDLRVPAVVLGAASFVLTFQPADRTVLIGALVVYGVTSVVAGKQLHDVSEREPWWTLLSWMLIAGGICTATVVFLIVAAPLALVTDVAVAQILSRAARESEGPAPRPLDTRPLIALAGGISAALGTSSALALATAPVARQTLAVVAFAAVWAGLSGALARWAKASPAALAAAAAFALSPLLELLRR